MLRSLDIRDMLIIDRLELGFRPGLNVLTGETGAGKSILLDCLGFVLGWRGRADVVRLGADQGEVVAVFDLPPGHAARAILAEAGLPVEDELILRRIAGTDGRKSAFVNDRRSSGEVLRALGQVLVELHGQADDGGLLNPRGHRALLDSFACIDSDLDQLRADWDTLSKARKHLAEAETALEKSQAEESFLRHAVEELDTLNPEPGEDASLDAERRLMQAGERIREDIARAHQALSPSGAEGLMRDAQRWLETAAEKAEGRLDGALAALDRALIELGDASDGVDRALSDLTFNPAELERVADRLFAIRALARKHDVLPDDLGPFADDLRGRLAALDGGAAGIKTLREQVTTAEAQFNAQAKVVSDLRHAAAKRLDTAMAAELAPLKMERAVFATDITPGDAGPEGQDTVSFTVATNPGAPSGPLNKIASGGELSRFLLALKVCLARHGEAQTMIFDEIDRGVGGATADAVGRRLAKLSQDAQLLVVTHSPQVAARGAHHWRVEKHVKGQVTTSTVVALDDTARRDEIARMLSGENVTEAARAAARELLAG